MYRSMLKFSVSLSMCLLLAACGGGNDSMSGVNEVDGNLEIAAASQVQAEQEISVAELLGEQGLGLFSDDPATSKREFLITGATVSSTSFWMCTFVESGHFLDRGPVRFNLDGSGSMGSTLISWEDSSGLFRIEGENEAFSIVNIEFDRRLYPADLFTADLTDGRTINCDWTGPPRTGQLLNDPMDDAIATDEDLFLDARLSTGIDLRDQDTYWNCQFGNANVPDAIYYFFSNGRFLAAEQGRWGLSGHRDIYITPDDGDSEIWSDIRFGELTDEGFNTFEATSDELGFVSCTIGGKPLAQVYVPQ